MRCLTAISILLAKATLASADAFDDASELFQATAHLREDGIPEVMQKMKAAAEKAEQFNRDAIEKARARVPEVAQKMKESLDKVTEALKVEVSELTKEAVKEELKRKSEDEEKAVKEAAAALVKEAQQQQPEETAAVQPEAVHQPSKYGDDVTITLHLQPGRELVTDFHSGMRLQAFMHSVTKKLGLPMEGVQFWHNQKVVSPMSTPKDVGISQKATFWINGPAVDAMVKKEAEAAAKAAELAKEDAAAENLRLAEEAERANRRHKAEQKNAEIHAEMQRKQDLSKQGRVTLEFVPTMAGKQLESVLIAVKRDNWLQGTMDLVCKRLDVSECQRARFHKADNKVEIKGTDSVRTLNLKEGEQVLVRVPVVKG